MSTDKFRMLRRWIAWGVSSLLAISPGLAAAQNPTDVQMQGATVKPDAKRAKKAAELGDKAEAAGRPDEALGYYQQAAMLAPQNEQIVEHSAALRSSLVRGHVDAAEKYALTGHMDAADRELATALAIDPSNTIVAERLAQMKSMEDEPPSTEVQEIAGLPKLEPKRGRKKIDVRGDSKTVYEQVAAMFGVKAAFDPDLPARNVRLRAEDVDFYTAMQLLAAQTGTFWRPLSGTLLFVALDNAEKRKQFGMVAEQVFGLSSVVSPEDMTEMLRIIRDISGSVHITLDTHSRTITMRDTPERLLMAGALIQEMEKARGEVMLEIELLEVDNGTARRLGVTPPSSVEAVTLSPGLLAELKAAQNLTALATLLAGIFGGNSGSGGATSLSSLVPPLVAVGGGKTTFLLTLPAAAVDFSDALSLVRSGRQVFLRAQDGKPATFFVGDRYPVTLSLLSSSLGNGGTQTASVGGNTVPFPSTAYQVGQNPVPIVSADFNNDGSIDLAVVNELDNTLSILLNQPSAPGTFVAVTPAMSLGTAPGAAPAINQAIATATLTSSGFADLLITDPANNQVLELLGNGDGTFKTPVAIPVGMGPSSIVTGTFNTANAVNPDSFQDFAVTNFSDNTVSIFLGMGDGTFRIAPGSPYALPTNQRGPIAIASGDFNADGRPDLVIADRTSNNVTMLLGNGDGTFTQAAVSPLATGTTPVAIAAGLLQTSGTASDFVVVNQGDATASIFLNNGNTTFVAPATGPLATGATPTAVVVGDFAQTGTTGFAVTNAGSNTVSVYAALTAGIFQEILQPPIGTNPQGIIAADLAGSGVPDLAATNNIAGGDGAVTVILSTSGLFSSGGNTQVPYPGSEYIDLGVKVKATPTMHANDEVTLQLEFEIRALSGSNVNGIPIISNRTLTQTVRVKEEQPTLIGGLTDREETRAITGLPGFAQIPVAGYAFGRRDTSLSDTQLLILVTPRKLRFPNRTSRALATGRENAGPTTPAISERPNQ